MLKRFAFIIFLFSSTTVLAQTKPAPEPQVSGIQAVISHSSVNVGGKKIDYTAYTGYLDLRNDTGKLIAKMFFVYYKKDGEVAAKRPLTFTFNGGPWIIICLASYGCHRSPPCCFKRRWHSSQSSLPGYQ
jgi:hypothetical protein